MDLYALQQEIILARYFKSRGIPVDEGTRNLNAVKDSRILIKICGDCLNNGGYDLIGKNLTDLYALGIIPTILHGGGSQIDEVMKKAGIPIVKVNGLRAVPDQKTLDCVIEGLKAVNMGLVGAINHYAKERYNTQDIAVGLTDDQIVYAQNMPPLSDKITGKVVDLGSVGEVTGIDYEGIDALLKEGKIPILWCIGYDVDGRPLNVNADMVGEALAKYHNKYILLTSVGGYINNGEIVLEMSLEEAKKHNADGGMGLKLDTAINALENTALKSITIASPENLPFELFLDKGRGTMITK